MLHNKILFSSNVAWSIYHFRKELLLNLQQQGFEIYTVAKEDKYAAQLKELDFSFTPVNINNNSKNPLNDMLLIRQYYKIYKKIQPDIILHNAIKPNIYGTMAAGILGIPTINNISGLGTLFIKKSFSTTLAKWLYKLSQQKASIVFFQNTTDLDLFVSEKLVSADKARHIPGSGVDTTQFHPSLNTNQHNKQFEFLFIARLLKDKGLMEYLEAAKILKQKYGDRIKCSILGPFYTLNETAITPQEMKQWTTQGIVNYLGETDEVANEIAHADCVVLPSYREGLSKVLIEASAMAKPIVTTDVPGCRDVVKDGFNGYLCKVKNAGDLAAKMEKMLLLDKNELDKIGKNARKHIEDNFALEIVINKYITIINEIL